MWSYLIAAGILAMLLYVAYHTLQKKWNQQARFRKNNDMLQQHTETILVCLRCGGNDAPAVVHCVKQAILNATSPLRLRFAVAQENAVVDVYDMFQQTIDKSDELSPSFTDKLKTANLVNSDGYFHAFAEWQRLYDGEKLVVCMEATNKLLPNWDCKLVRYMQECNSRTAVASCPSAQQFSILTYGEAHQRYWPQVVGRRFVYEDDEPTDSIAAHHQFLCMYGDVFRLLQSPHVFAPLYVVDVVLSSYLVQNRCVLKTMPLKLFEQTSTVDNAYFFHHRPPQWQRRLDLGPEFMLAAGIKRRPQDGAYVLQPRARLGLTRLAMHTSEAMCKYGTKREVHRQFALLEQSLM